VYEHHVDNNNSKLSTPFFLRYIHPVFDNQNIFIINTAFSPQTSKTGSSHLIRIGKSITMIWNLMIFCFFNYYNH